MVATALSLVMVALGLRLDPDVASLLPERGEASALRRYLRAFGGSDLSMVLVSEADDVDANADRPPIADVANELAAALERQAAVRRAAAGLSAVEQRASLDPCLLYTSPSPRDS